MNRLFLISLIFVMCMPLFGQDKNTVSWKGYKKQAEELINMRQYAKAAMAYENAYKLKTQRGDFLKLAAENYMLERDFSNAARIFSIIVNNPKYRNVRLDYAYSLKQSNQYEEAMIIFASLLNEISNSKLEAKINNEIMGCQFALDQLEGYDVKPYGIDIAQLDYSINSEKSDFAPFHVSDTKMYYSTLQDGNAKIRSSAWVDGEWATGSETKGFAAFKNKHFCNAIVNAEDNEMFFTICDEDQVWGGLSSRCDLYRSNKKGKAWGQPKKLNSNINFDGATNTQPCVITRNERQFLYFASNRPGGQGGMDIWVSSRVLNNEKSQFEAAINLGPNINTSSNEITPFYNHLDGILYFSSDGHLNMGGFDIFKSVGEGFSWSKAENIGLPVNTGADEKYYTLAGANTDGYFVSNRLFGETKNSTTHEDIFTFKNLPPHYFVEGSVMDQQSMNWIEDAQVYLYEMKEETEDRRLLSIKNAKGGHYNFRLLVDKSYQLGVEADGYATNVEFVNTKNENLYVQEKNIKLFTGDQDNAVASVDGLLSSDAVAVAPSATIDSPIKNTKVAKQQMSDIQQEIAATTPKEPFVIGGPQPSAEAPSIKPTLDTASTATSASTPSTATPLEPFVIGETKQETATIAELKDTPAIIAYIPTPEPTPAPTYTKSTTSNTTSSYAAPSSSSTTYTESSRSTEAYIANSITSSSTSNTYAATTTNTSNFVSKGATVPSGTGIYTYDEYNNKFNKQGGSVTAVDTYSSSTSYTESSVNASEITSVPVRNTFKASSSKVVSGSSYKVQIVVVETHNPNHRRYDGIRNLGFDLNTEYLEDKGWTRVLLGTYRTEAEAREIVQTAKSSGFKTAFVVQYQDGERRGRVN